MIAVLTTWLKRIVLNLSELLFTIPVAGKWLNLVLSLGVTLTRFGAGSWVVERADVSNRPRKPVILFDDEASPSCRGVRETLSTLGLDVVVYPIPQGASKLKGAHSRHSASHHGHFASLFASAEWEESLHAVQSQGGSVDLPILVDMNTDYQEYANLIGIPAVDVCGSKASNGTCVEEDTGNGEHYLASKRAFLQKRSTAGTTAAETRVGRSVASLTRHYNEEGVIKPAEYIAQSMLSAAAAAQKARSSDAEVHMHDPLLLQDARRINDYLWAAYGNEVKTKPIVYRLAHWLDGDAELFSGKSYPAAEASQGYSMMSKAYRSIPALLRFLPFAGRCSGDFASLSACHEVASSKIASDSTSAKAGSSHPHHHITHPSTIRSYGSFFSIAHVEHGSTDGSASPTNAARKLLRTFHSQHPPVLALLGTEASPCSRMVREVLYHAEVPYMLLGGLNPYPALNESAAGTGPGCGNFSSKSMAVREELELLRRVKCEDDSTGTRKSWGITALLLRVVQLVIGSRILTAITTRLQLPFLLISRAAPPCGADSATSTNAGVCPSRELSSASTSSTADSNSHLVLLSGGSGGIEHQLTYLQNLFHTTNPAATDREFILFHLTDFCMSAITFGINLCMVVALVIIRTAMCALLWPFLYLEDRYCNSTAAGASKRPGHPTQTVQQRKEKLKESESAEVKPNGPKVVATESSKKKKAN